ncbi:MAG: hypothetical protein LCH26_03845 [Proteobacteria bacterium]|nr:hypothetical protein [Pseudomonadota bacterium]
MKYILPALSVCALLSGASVAHASASSENVPPLDLQNARSDTQIVSVIQGSPRGCLSLTTDNAFLQKLPENLHYGAPRQNGASEVNVSTVFNGQKWHAQFYIGAVGTQPSGPGRPRITLPSSTDAKRCLYFYYDGNGNEYRFTLEKAA